MTTKATKQVFFYKHHFYITKEVFLPRFETEQLVDLTINYGEGFFNKKITVLEIGCGSGVVALSLALVKPDWQVDAVDIDDKAIALAKQNQQHFKVKSVNFWKSDMFSRVKKKYDLIIANLPYVATNSPFVDPKILKWDPKRALFAKENGLELIRICLEEVKMFLNNKFLIALEIGFQQKTRVIKLIKQNLGSVHWHVVKDFNQIERFVFIYKV